MTVVIKVTDCTFSEQLLLWAVRAWVIDFGVGRKPSPLIEDAFTQAYMPSGALDLDRVMTSLASGAVRSLDIRCTCATHLSADEQRLLRVFSVAQMGEAIARVWLQAVRFGSDFAVPIIARMAERLVCNLMSVGLSLPMHREWDVLFFDHRIEQGVSRTSMTRH